MKKNVKKIVSLLLISCLIFGFTGCAGKTNTTDSVADEETKLEKIKESGKLVIGTSADYPPYEFHYVKGGKDEIAGFDIAIAKEIAKDIGVELVIEDMGFEGLLAALESNKIDIVIAGMTPTDKRKESVDFSKVYYTALQNALVSTENKEVLKTIEDLTGKKIGVQKATIQEDLAKEQIENVEIEALTSIADLVLELKSNRIDAVIAEAPVASAYAKNIDGIEVADVQFETSDSGSAIAVSKGNEDLVEAINKTIDRLIEENKIEEFVVDAIKLSEEN